MGFDVSFITAFFLARWTFSNVTRYGTPVAKQTQTEATPPCHDKRVGRHYQASRIVSTSRDFLRRVRDSRFGPREARSYGCTTFSCPNNPPKELWKLQRWLISAKTRFRHQPKVAMDVEELLDTTGAMSVCRDRTGGEGGVAASIRGRSGKNTNCVKRFVEIRMTKYQQLRQARTP
jgi:hypothetical protein